MYPLILITDGFDPILFKQMQSFPDWEIIGPKVHPAEIHAPLLRAQGLVVRSATQVTHDFLSNAPQLRYVVRAGEGIDNIDLDACRKRSIHVANTPGANSNSAAEQAIALMFSVLRKIPWAHQSMKQGTWDKNQFAGNELTGKVLGVVGMGRIGQILCQRLQGFALKIRYYDPVVESVSGFPCQRVHSLEELFSTSDIISLHLPLNAKTQNLIDGRILSCMPSHGVLINASRGNIVCEDALFECLSQNKIRGAGLDVFATEPLPLNSPLRNLANIILTPHIGASTEEAQFRVGEMVVQQLREFFFNHNLINEVKK